MLMDDVVTLIRECLPDSDIAMAKYNSSLFSNSPADKEAPALALEIGRLVEDKAKESGSYEEIFLIGHSLGGLCFAPLTSWPQVRKLPLAIPSFHKTGPNRHLYGRKVRQKDPMWNG